MAGLKAALAQLASAKPSIEKGQTATPTDTKCVANQHRNVSTVEMKSLYALCVVCRLEFWFPLYRSDASKPQLPPQPAGMTTSTTSLSIT
jgi:hypothetical protein